ncbi:MAG: hypothetical protein H0T42_27655 [Deltaproteobacteria bacterium]|nr:hypothetical protein [Deltaproteobacteria bacterium]
MRCARNRRSSSSADKIRLSPKWVSLVAVIIRGRSFVSQRRRARGAGRAPPSTGPGPFAVARTAGWLAHALEQRTAGFLLRPRARYTGVSVAGALAASLSGGRSVGR